MHLTIWQLAGISLIWGAAGARIGWLWCDYRRFCERIDRARRESMRMAMGERPASHSTFGQRRQRMRLCDWCGETVPEDDRKFVNLRPENWPYNDTNAKHVQIQLHPECCGALVGILREGDMPRPAPLEQKQGRFRALRAG